MVLRKMISIENKNWKQYYKNVIYINKDQNFLVKKSFILHWIVRSACLLLSINSNIIAF